MIVEIYLSIKKIGRAIKRSMFTTIASAIIGLIILAVSILILPISNAGEAITFAVGILLVILCGVTAFQGKKGAVKDIIYTMGFWR